MNKWYTAWICLLLLMSTGCAVNTYKNTYSLNNICIARANCCGASPYTLLINEVSASYGYDTDQMLYMECPYQIKAYSQNRWLVAPNQMLTPLLAQYIRNTCYFHAVVTPPFSACADYRLETRLLKLQQEFLCCPSRVRMILHATLVNNKTNCIITERVFGTVILAPENNPYGGVVAANRATQQLLCQISQFVVDNIHCAPACLPKPKRIVMQEELYLPPPNERFSLQ